MLGINFVGSFKVTGLCALFILSFDNRLRDELRSLPSTYKCRHDAAADLIHIYAYTKCLFKVRVIFYSYPQICTVLRMLLLIFFKNSNMLTKLSELLRI
jgi:Protein SET DOMAIN GROUP 2 C-terminal